MKTYTTLSEIQRTCRLVASTDVNYSEYNTKKKEAEEAGPWEMISDYGEFSIYTNELYYITLHQRGAVLRLWKLINHHL